ncbi:MAG: methyltransferase domain-containing protein [Candidatus Saccharimonadales bacterium]
MSNIWGNVHKNNYAKSDWVDKPSLFAETAITYFPKSGKVLELGAGQGQDSRYFAEHGYEVVSTDLEPTALEIGAQKLPPELAKKVTFTQVDLHKELPFENELFDVVYAHLSLHYFDTETTHQLFGEVHRVLKPGGVLAIFTNSTSDPEYKTGEEIEPDFFRIGEVEKRYFSVETMRPYVQYLEIKLLDDHGETYKDSAKGVHGLIRFIGTKPKVEVYRTAIPFAGAIVERGSGEDKEVLLQTRWQPGGDPVYSGTLEFPVGRLDEPYENIFDTVAREIKEETSLTLQAIQGVDKTAIFSGGKDDAAFGFRPFCCLQQLKNGKPWVGFIFVCTVEPGEPKGQLSESRDVRWVKASDVKKMVATSPEKLFTLELPAWGYYFSEKVE